MDKLLSDVSEKISERVSMEEHAGSGISSNNSFYPNDTSESLRNLIRQYEASASPLTVSFRQLVAWISMGERASHYIHSYPAKLLPQIGHYFLAAFDYFPKNCIVLDPFSGTGTVALEAILSGRKAYYVDSNPLARLIAKVKTTPVSEDSLIQGLNHVKSAFGRIEKGHIPDVVNINYWYDDESILELSRLKLAIEEVQNDNVKDVLKVTFSTVCRKVSLADPRLSVPVKRKTKSAETYEAGKKL